ncbi:MAG: hypothetical protein F6K16_34265 [Symploca sp. SIO2B6]|nr:hypothetical protein [Symploca sp. SIO2B6]
MILRKVSGLFARGIWKILGVIHAPEGSIGPIELVAPASWLHWPVDDVAIARFRFDSLQFTASGLS